MTVIASSDEDSVDSVVVIVVQDLSKMKIAQV